MSQETSVLEAPDPTNIVWEDLGISGSRLKCNNINANLLMTALVLGAFFLFWFLRYIPNKVQKAFPTSTHCGAIQDTFDVNNNMAFDKIIKTPEFAKFKTSANWDRK